MVPGCEAPETHEGDGTAQVEGKSRRCYASKAFKAA
jgi:hypothetical protein